MHTASADPATIRQRAPGVDPRGFLVVGAKGLHRLESEIHQLVLPLDSQLVVRELVRLLPRALLEHDDIKASRRELLRQHPPCCARTDDYKIDGVALAKDTLLHATRFGVSVVACASYQPNGVV